LSGAIINTKRSNAIDYVVIFIFQVDIDIEENRTKFTKKNDALISHPSGYWRRVEQTAETNPVQLRCRNQAEHVSASSLK
jgi:hypothetical protein